MSPKIKLFIIGSVWPEPNSSAAGSHILQLIELCKEDGWDITFACTATESEYMFDLKKLGVKKASIQLNNISFDEFIKALQPDVVLFDRFMSEEQFGWRVADNCPGAIRVLNTEDLHCLRFARLQALKAKRKFTNQDLFNDIAKREIASVYRSDLSLIISTFETALLTDFFKVDEELLQYAPFLLNSITREVTSKWPDFERRKDFMTIGNFLHEPNVDALNYLKQEIWPLIRMQLPGAKVYNYGAYPSGKINQLHNPEVGFYIMGRAEDTNEVFGRARICLAPLRAGAGLKGKLTDAMIFGTPSVTTSIGAEGMANSEDWNGTIADNAQDFANAAVRLYSDRKLWEKAQTNGAQIINSSFRKEIWGPSIIERIKALVENPDIIRKKNFTGSMLMYHTIASTKYMSRWIELKNLRSSMDL